MTVYAAGSPCLLLCGILLRMTQSTDRRHFLRVAATIPGVALAARYGLLPGVAHARAGEAHAILSRMAFLLFPFPELGAEPYARVATALADDAANRSLVDAALADFPDDWLDANTDRQLEHLQHIEAGPFFQFVLAGVRTRLFNDREVWAYLNYGGSSMAFGGYIDRGLDEIDWLEDA